MKTNYNIQGFKCFQDSTFELNKLTVLTGANGSGKSSVIQSLLLLKQSLTTQEKLFIEDKCEAKVLLNGEYSLNLGLFDDIINSDSKRLDFTLQYNDNVFSFFTTEDQIRFDQISVLYPKAQLEEDILPELRYLNAERIGPRYNSDNSYTSNNHCGFKGEHTAKIIYDNDSTKTKILEAKIFEEKEETRDFTLQLNFWLGYICPGISVYVQHISDFVAQVRLRNSNKSSVAPNIGFGISYVLPILVNGLLSSNNSTFIVENPEAHLHPKAQSNLGYFLGQMAGAGTNIIIETHSEHIVNGIRRAALSDIGLKHSDVNIYFFEDYSAKSHLIQIDPKGNLSDFPVDFFDQVRQDMLEIIQLSQNK